MGRQQGINLHRIEGCLATLKVKLDCTNDTKVELLETQKDLLVERAIVEALFAVSIR